MTDAEFSPDLSGWTSRETCALCKINPASVPLHTHHKRFRSQGGGRHTRYPHEWDVRAGPALEPAPPTAGRQAGHDSAMNRSRSVKTTAMTGKTAGPGSGFPRF